MEKIVIELKQSDFDGDLSKNNPLSVCNAIYNQNRHYKMPLSAK